MFVFQICSSIYAEKYVSVIASQRRSVGAAIRPPEALNISEILTDRREIRIATPVTSVTGSQ
jgi:hypothetical protein